MKKFTVTVHVVAEQTFEIEAEDEFEAVSTARDMFDFDEADIINSDAEVDEIIST